MFLLDTDLLSLLDRDSPESRRLTERLLLVPPDEVAVSIITYEEQLRGWLAWIAAPKTSAAQVDGYDRLRRHIKRYRIIPIVDYGADAATRFDELRKSGVRIGTMDLRIAAIALANGATLLSRNLRDFEKVPNLLVEDWTRPLTT